MYTCIYHHSKETKLSIEEGSESSFKLLESLKGISVFAISHNEGNRERFNNSIVVEKQNDFSVITYKE